MQPVVVHYVDARSYGGVEQLVRLLLSRIDRERWSPLLYLHGYPGIQRLVDETRDLGIPTRILPAPSDFADISAFGRWRAQLAADRPAIFHAHLNWPLGCRHGLIAARLAGLPYVVATAHLYRPIDGASWRRIKQWLQASTIDRYIAVSAEVELRLRRDLGVDPHKLRLVHNGIEVSASPLPPSPSLRKELLQGTHRHLALTVARLHAQKGLDHLLDAAAVLPDLLFAVAGDGPEHERLEARARVLGISDRVRFLGHRRDVPALLASCDLFVLPSLYEGLPLSLLEAMAAGRPVVATDIGGTREAVNHGVTGWLVPPADGAALAATIRSVLADGPGTARVTGLAREHVRSHFSIEATSRSIERIYDEDLERRQRRDTRDVA